MQLYADIVHADKFSVCMTVNLHIQSPSPSFLPTAVWYRILSGHRCLPLLRSLNVRAIPEYVSLICRSPAAVKHMCAVGRGTESFSGYSLLEDTRNVMLRSLVLRYSQAGPRTHNQDAPLSMNRRTTSYILLALPYAQEEFSLPQV